MLVGYEDILGVGVDPSEAGECNSWECQALVSDKHDSHPGFANLLKGQVWTSYSVSLSPNFLIYKLEMI